MCISISEIPFFPKHKCQKVNSAQCYNSMNISNLNFGLIFLFTFICVNFGLSLFRSQNEKIFPPKGCDPWINSISSPRLFLFFSSSYITKMPFKFIKIATKNCKKMTIYPQQEQLPSMYSQLFLSLREDGIPQ